MVCYVMLCDVMISNVTLCYEMSCFILLWYAMLCNVMSCYDIILLVINICCSSQSMNDNRMQQQLTKIKIEMEKKTNKMVETKIKIKMYFKNDRLCHLRPASVTPPTPPTHAPTPPTPPSTPPNTPRCVSEVAMGG